MILNDGLQVIIFNNLIMYKNMELVYHKKVDLPGYVKMQLPELMQRMYALNYQLPPPDLTHFASTLADIDPAYSSNFIIVKEEDTLLGYLQFDWIISDDNNYLNLAEIFVVEEYRRNKLASRMLSKMLNYIPKSLRNVILWSVNDTDSETFVKSIFDVNLKFSAINSAMDLKEVTVQDTRLPDGYVYKFIDNASFDLSEKLLISFVKLVNDINKSEEDEMTLSLLLDRYMSRKKMGFKYKTFLIHNNNDVFAINEIIIKPLQPEVAHSTVIGLKDGSDIVLLNYLNKQMHEKLVSENVVEYITIDEVKFNNQKIC